MGEADSSDDEENADAAYGQVQQLKAGPVTDAGGANHVAVDDVYTEAAELQSRKAEGGEQNQDSTYEDVVAENIDYADGEGMQDYLRRAHDALEGADADVAAINRDISRRASGGGGDENYAIPGDGGGGGRMYEVVESTPEIGGGAPVKALEDAFC